MYNSMEMRVKIFMSFLNAVFNMSFHHFSPYPPLLYFGSVTKHLQRTSNNCKPPVSKMVVAWGACSLAQQLYEQQFEDSQSHMKTSVCPYLHLPIHKLKSFPYLCISKACHLHNKHQLKAHKCMSPTKFQVHKHGRFSVLETESDMFKQVL